MRDSTPVSPQGCWWKGMGTTFPSPHLLPSTGTNCCLQGNGTPASVFWWDEQAWKPIRLTDSLWVWLLLQNTSYRLCFSMKLGTQTLRWQGKRKKAVWWGPECFTWCLFPLGRRAARYLCSPAVPPRQLPAEPRRVPTCA